MKVIGAERTFWDKTTLLHHQTCRSIERSQSRGYSRHYFGLACMAQSPVKDAALNNLALVESVIAYKKQFFCQGWSQYDAARPGGLKLVPTSDMLEVSQEEYRAMRNMFFGSALTTSTILQALHALEDDIKRA